jgi:hypothetical protein
MIIRLVRLVLPARLKAKAGEEARVIAAALARELAQRGVKGATQSLTLPGAGQTGAGIAHRIGPSLRAGGRHGD